jgi:hypothetical protein
MPLNHPPACVSMRQACCPILSGTWIVTLETSLTWSPFVLHTWPEHGLVMLHLAVGVGNAGLGYPLTGSLSEDLIVRPASHARSAGTWSSILLRRHARRGFGSSYCLVGLLGGDLVVRLASQACSAGTWSFVSLHMLARRGLGHPFRLVGLLGEDLVVHLPCRLVRTETWLSIRFAGLHLEDLVIRPTSQVCSANEPGNGYGP